VTSCCNSSLVRSGSSTRTLLMSSRPPLLRALHAK
jgi:hypothetical protein